jgi:hypothetical protein
VGQDIGNVGHVRRIGRAVRKPRRADRTLISIASFAPGLSHVWSWAYFANNQSPSLPIKAGSLPCAAEPGGSACHGSVRARSDRMTTKATEVFSSANHAASG